jgi:hypothetical protein
MVWDPKTVNPVYVSAADAAKYGLEVIMVYPNGDKPVYGWYSNRKHVVDSKGTPGQALGWIPMLNNVQEGDPLKLRIHSVSSVHPRYLIQWFEPDNAKWWKMTNNTHGTQLCGRQAIIGVDKKENATTFILNKGISYRKSATVTRNCHFTDCGSDGRVIGTVKGAPLVDPNNWGQSGNGTAYKLALYESSNGQITGERTFQKLAVAKSLGDMPLIKRWQEFGMETMIRSSLAGELDGFDVHEIVETFLKEGMNRVENSDVRAFLAEFGKYEDDTPREGVFESLELGNIELDAMKTLCPTTEAINENPTCSAYGQFPTGWGTDPVENNDDDGTEDGFGDALDGEEQTKSSSSGTGIAFFDNLTQNQKIAVGAGGAVAAFLLFSMMTRRR